MTPAARFRPAGPRFRLLFGETVADDPGGTVSPGTLFIGTPSTAEDVFGWGVIYALHARACVERGRGWQAEHYIGAVRDHALALACFRVGLPPAQARTFDDLPAETLARFDGSHIGSLEPGALRDALADSVAGLVREGEAARLPRASVVAERLVELGRISEDPMG